MHSHSSAPPQRARRRRSARHPATNADADADDHPNSVYAGLQVTDSQPLHRQSASPTPSRTRISLKHMPNSIRGRMVRV